jgi:hypothetical protein
MPADNSVKILFRFYSDILDEETTETIWGEVYEKEHGYYKLETIPFFVPKIATGDIVWAEYSEKEGMLTYRKTVQRSGNSTIHVIIMDEAYDEDTIREVFNNLGCRSEIMNQRYFAVEVPAAIDYIPVKRKLDELEKQGILDYAESGLSPKHEYKSISFGS